MIKNWTTENATAMGNEMVASGVSLIWNKYKINAFESIFLEDELMNVVDFLLVTLAKAKTSLTNARKLAEDIITMSLASSHPHTDWVKSLMKQGDVLRCSQGWTEKQMKKLIDASGGDSVLLTKDWAKYAVSKDQEVAMKKLEAYYVTQKGKESRRLSSKQYQDRLVDLPGGLFGAGFGWSALPK